MPNATPVDIAVLLEILHSNYKSHNIHFQYVKRYKFDVFDIIL